MNLFELPVEVVKVLYPFKVRNGYAAGVAEDIGDNEYAFIKKDFICFRGSGAVGQLSDNFCLNACGVIFNDSILEAEGQRMSTPSSRSSSLEMF